MSPPKILNLHTSCRIDRPTGSGYWLLGMNEILAFWFAYVVTRPLSASCADWLGKPKSMGGVGLGTGRVSLILAILIIVFVGYLTVARKDLKGE